MNKLLVTLGLAATVALVGCNKDKAPETGATTGEHLENAAEQAGADIKDATARSFATRWIFARLKQKHIKSMTWKVLLPYGFLLD